MNAPVIPNPKACLISWCVGDVEINKGKPFYIDFRKGKVYREVPSCLGFRRVVRVRWASLTPSEQIRAYQNPLFRSTIPTR